MAKKIDSRYGPPKWEIGKEIFTELDKSTYELWYARNTETDDHWGGFKTEKEVLTFLLKQV